MKRLVFLAALASALHAFADEPNGPRSFKLILPAGDVLEECVLLKAGEKRAYSWKSDRPMDFNVHYHKDKKVAYPVKKDQVASDDGTFAATIAETYCWMWTAGKFPTRIEGKVAGP